LDNALVSDLVNAIESDIIISSVTGEAVMAHPPSTHSDLSFEDFMEKCIEHNAASFNGGFGRPKHLKLDFKQLIAVKPCLTFLAKNRERIALGDVTVWLNADVLPGPGTSHDSVSIPPDEFIAESQVCVCVPCSHVRHTPNLTLTHPADLPFLT